MRTLPAPPAVSYRGRWAGSMGDVGCFSFHPRKVIVTGEGGMYTTSDPKKAETINCLRNHGASVSEEQRHHGNAPYLMPDFNVLGYNYRMTDLQGAMGLVQLGRLDNLIAEHQKWADWYAGQLSEIKWLQPPSVPAGHSTSWKAYVCRGDESLSPLSAPEDSLCNSLKTELSCRPVKINRSILSISKSREESGFNVV